MQAAEKKCRTKTFRHFSVITGTFSIFILSPSPPPPPLSLSLSLPLVGSGRSGRAMLGCEYEIVHTVLVTPRIYKHKVHCERTNAETPMRGNIHRREDDANEDNANYRPTGNSLRVMASYTVPKKVLNTRSARYARRALSFRQNRK